MYVNILPSPHDTQTTVANVKYRTNFNQHIAFFLLHRLALSGCFNKPLFSKHTCRQFPSTYACHGKRVECFPIWINFKNATSFPLLQPSVEYTAAAPDTHHTFARTKLRFVTSTFSKRSDLPYTPKNLAVLSNFFRHS